MLKLKNTKLILAVALTTALFSKTASADSAQAELLLAATVPPVLEIDAIGNVAELNLNNLNVHVTDAKAGLLHVRSNMVISSIEVSSDSDSGKPKNGTLDPANLTSWLIKVDNCTGLTASQQNFESASTTVNASITVTPPASGMVGDIYCPILMTYTTDDKVAKYGHYTVKYTFTITAS